ncbi:MAG: magnesium transporter [Gammaproteobacteria bacterium]|nr:magnesium transporter [Gammaproteobacteria bacterium]NIR83362.1 magnesium transporter [Gammaproteobacteria bacterium]NIR91162.1 magnesium transporter [Gammaproteobacteria bacterium]NIU04529.1 magnesium transporter [Gammaproteobacteria bacterium]NIW87165.1 magnesium transporter [Gammaproteobacteria bacterium]
MNREAEEEHRVERLEALHDALERDALEKVRELIRDLHPAEAALLLESLPHKERDIVWEQIDEEQHTDVLAEAGDEVRASRMLQMAPEQLAAAALELDADDAVDILQDLPERVIEEVLLAMDEQNRRRLEGALVYPEDTAGGLMNIDTITVRGDVTLGVVLRFLRRKGDIPKKMESLVVVDRDNRYQGMLPITRLLTQEPQLKVVDVMDRDIKGIPATTADSEVAKLFEQRDLISAPVVDDEGVLLGHIFIDDVVDVIRNEGEHSFMSMAGLDEEVDMFAPIGITARRRSLWLGVNLATAFIAAWVIGLFEATIGQVVALAVLMPVVASMGGIAGTQTLTVVIRGMALGQLGQRNAGWLLAKELLVGLINSLFWALVVALVAVVWFDNTKLGIIVAVALVVNLVVAAISGALIPLILRRFSVDPALAGGVILTTVTDVVGFMTFLGLGTLFLLG